MLHTVQPLEVPRTPLVELVLARAAARGARAALIDAHTGHTVSYLNDSDARILLTVAGLAPTWRDAIDGTRVEHVITLDAPPPDGPEALAFASLTADESAAAPHVAIEPDDLVLDADGWFHTGDLGHATPYKKVRRLEFIDAIPKSPSGKILRRLLKERPVP